MLQPIEIHVVNEVNKPIRLQEYGVGIFKNCPTKSALKKRLKKGLITVNDQIGSTATYISGNEVIKLFPDNKRTPVFPLKLKVLYEDDYLAIIHKVSDRPFLYKCQVNSVLWHIIFIIYARNL